MNGLMSLPQWHSFLHHPTGPWLGFINAIYTSGMVVSYPFVAVIANRFGRKKGIHLGNILLVVGTVLQTSAQNSATFIMGRLFLGFAAGFYSLNVPLLINETAYPTHRSILSALSNCGFYFGSLIASWATFGTRNYSNSWGWRIPSLLQILLPITAIPGLVLIPESPRWLISKGYHKDAQDAITEMHAGSDIDSMALVNYEVNEIATTLAEDKLANETTSYKDMIATKGNRHRLLITVSVGIFAQWSGNGVVSYYLALVLNTVGVTSSTNQLLISACLQLWNLILAVLASCLVDKLGRRFLFLASASIMLVSFIIITALSGSFASTGSSAAGLAVVPFLFVFFAGYDIAL